MFCRLILLLSLAFPLLSKAVTIKTISYGDWEDNLVWSDGQVPGAVDTILIRHYITLNQNLTVTAPTVIFIEASGTICGDFLLETLCGASLINHGHLYLN
ncbi:MAG: hypothetical protein K0R26_1611 [Bacteroidota bacterium]|jgi:hypothetical protein|nr:hypothetical protein [Bacteroidota bacterium]